MSKTFRQEERNVMDRNGMAVSDFDVASCGDEFHWDGESLGVDVSDLECGSLMISDLHHDIDLSMQSTVHV
jgi:hypothetical protein